MITRNLEQESRPNYVARGDISIEDKGKAMKGHSLRNVFSGGFRKNKLAATGGLLWF